MSNLQGARGEQTGWSRHFDDPIPTGNGGELRSLRDAGVYILALPPPQVEREHWQAAMEALILVAERGGPKMLARIGVLRALHRMRRGGLEAVRRALPDHPAPPPHPPSPSRPNALYPRQAGPL